MAGKTDENQGVIITELAYIKRDIAEIKQTVTQNYVTRNEYEPVKKIVYGLVSIILIAVVGGILSAVIK